MNAVLIEKVTLDDVKRIVEVCIAEGFEKNKNSSSVAEELLKEREVAELLQITRQTLKSWRDAGQIPFIRIGSKIRYRKSEIIEKSKA